MKAVLYRTIENGSVEALVAFHVDVEPTHFLQRLAELFNSEEWYTKLFTDVGGIISTIQPDGTIVLPSGQEPFPLFKFDNHDIFSIWMETSNIKYAFRALPGEWTVAEIISTHPVTDLIQ